MKTNAKLDLDFNAIPTFTRKSNYHVTVPWLCLERQLVSMGEGTSLDLDPDFQRAHVWNESKRSRYVEFILRRGHSSRDIYFNCAKWPESVDGEPLVLVDGKQRLDAVRRFLHDEVLAFGRRYSEFSGKLNMLVAYFDFHINSLETRAEVLQWYLDLNTGGVCHTPKEIAKVQALLRMEHR